MSDSISQSRSRLHDQTDANVNAAYHDLSKRLLEFKSRYNDEQEAVAATSTLHCPLSGDVINWDSLDGSRSGIIELGKIMKSFKKLVASGENEIAHKHKDAFKLDTAIKCFVKGSLGPTGLGRAVTEPIEALAWSEQEQEELEAKFEVEEAWVLKRIGEENALAQEALKDVEKVRLSCSFVFN